MFVGGENILTNKGGKVLQANGSFYAGLSSTSKKECSCDRKLIIVRVEKFAKYSY